jgi:hypothetical protein
MTVVWSSALRTGHLCPLVNIPSTHFCEGPSRPQGHSVSTIFQMTPSGIEPSTFRLEADRHPVTSTKTYELQTSISLWSVIQNVLNYILKFGTCQSVVAERATEVVLTLIWYTTDGLLLRNSMLLANFTRIFNVYLLTDISHSLNDFTSVLFSFYFESKNHKHRSLYGISSPYESIFNVFGMQ